MASMNSMGTRRSTSVVSANQATSLGVLHRQIPAGGPAIGIAPKFTPTLSEEEALVQARLLKALADPTRLRILSLLSRHEGEVCVFEIVESFTLEQPTISHHLRILRDAGLVDCRKKGLWAYYYVRREALTRATTTTRQRRTPQTPGSQRTTTCHQTLRDCRARHARCRSTTRQPGCKQRARRSARRSRDRKPYPVVPAQTTSPSTARSPPGPPKN